jgi:hypothetical protein
MTAPKQNPFDAMCDGTITSRYQDREDRLADWNRQLTHNRLLLDSLAPKENAAREILSSDVLPPVKRNAEAILADIERRRERILDGIARCEHGVRDLEAELKLLQPAYEKYQRRIRLHARLTGLQQQMR